MKIFLPPCPHCNVLCPLEVILPESTVTCPSCQGSFFPEKRFGDFLVKKRYANRFGSQLYTGEICGSETPVVLQFLPTEVVADPDFEQMLSEQVDRLSSNPHPNLAPLAGYLHSYGECCLAWEVPEGFSLDTLFDTGRRMAESQVLGFLEQLADALDVAHSAGLFHGTISPDCIFLSKNSVPVLLGLGFHHGIEESQLIGNPKGAMYLAPEYFNGEVGLPADYYGLGEILYQALVGHPVFRLPKGYTMDAFWDTKRRKAWIPELVPPISKNTERIVEMLLEVNPETRCSDSAVLIAAAQQAREAMKAGFAPRVTPSVVTARCNLGKPIAKQKTVPWAAVCGVAGGLSVIVLAAIFWILPRGEATARTAQSLTVTEPASTQKQPEAEVQTNQTIAATDVAIAATPATTNRNPVQATSDKIRYFPRLGHGSRMVGGVFEGTDGDAISGTYTSIYTITQTPEEVWTEVQIPLENYRYLRYRAPSGFCNVAEIEFYRGPVKLAGPAFGTPGSQSQTIQDAHTAALDGNPATFFDSSEIGDAYVGVDTRADQISYVPVPDKPSN